MSASHTPECARDAREHGGANECFRGERCRANIRIRITWLNRAEPTYIWVSPEDANLLWLTDQVIRDHSGITNAEVGA